MEQVPVLEAKDISFSFGNSKPILKEVSFTVGAGKFVVLTGRNGSGKSVLLKCLKGLYQPTKGSISIDGEDFSKLPKRRNSSIGLVFQDAESQMVGQTVERDILFGLENLGIEGDERRRRFEDVVGLLGLSPLLNQRPRTLSGGEKRRLAIAGVLVMDPHVLILDEPFANLDLTGVRQVLEALVALHAKGHAIMVVTHEIEKVLAHADQLILLDGGRVIGDDKPSRVLSLVEDYGVRRPSFQGRPVPLEALTWLK
jgi:biotin transport system ATP-binding protein